jgi:hypothetical protein
MGKATYISVFLFVLITAGNAFSPRSRITRRSPSIHHFCQVRDQNSAQSDRGYSFVQNEMRGAAMKLHTRDQAPLEGKEQITTPYTRWEPTRQDYAQFLVDSLEVYTTFEEIVCTPMLSVFWHQYTLHSYNLTFFATSMFLSHLG